MNILEFIEENKAFGYLTQLNTAKRWERSDHRHHDMDKDRVDLSCEFWKILDREDSNVVKGFVYARGGDVIESLKPVLLRAFRRWRKEWTDLIEEDIEKL